MNNPPFLVAYGDLIILFLYGAALCLFGQSISLLGTHALFAASFALAFFLGFFGPSIGELIEWAFFFFLGVAAVYLYPHFLEYQQTQVFSYSQIFESLKAAGLYSTKLFSAWTFSLPAGYVLHKLTSTVGYYRHNSF